MPPEVPGRVDNERQANQESGVLSARIRMEVVLHLSDCDLSVHALARRLGISSSVLYRRVAELHDAGPAELMRELRLEEDARLLTETDEQVSSIAYATGFRSVPHFSQAF